MKMQQVSETCFAVLIEKNRVCDANSGDAIYKVAKAKGIEVEY